MGRRQAGPPRRHQDRHRVPHARLDGTGRIWGSGDFVHWFNLDGHRPGKERAFVLDLGGTVKPVVTPDDPDAFRAALVAAGVPVGS